MFCFTHICISSVNIPVSQSFGAFTRKSLIFLKFLDAPNELVICYAEGPAEQPSSAEAPKELACDTAFLYILFVI